MIVRGDARLELYQVEGAEAVPIARQEVATTLKFGGINHLGLVVDNIDGLLDALKAKGVDIALQVSEVPNGSGDRFAFFYDNDRMLVELFQPAG